VAKTERRSNSSDDHALLALFGAIAARDQREVARRLDASPDLAVRPIQVGASRQDSDPYFLDAIRHHVYRGDTALHVAAAAHHREVASSLVAKGADVAAGAALSAWLLRFGSPLTR